MFIDPSLRPKIIETFQQEKASNPQNLSVSYGVFERVFRTTVFQFAVYSAGWIEKVIFFIYRACVNRTYQPEPFSDKRMNDSLDVLRALGGKDKFVIPADGKSKIHMITMRSSDLENIIKKKGGQWIKEGNEFIIIPPKQKDQDWLDFQKNYLLNKTGWFVAQRKDRQVIVTCEHADLVDRRTLCFLHIHNPMARERGRAAFYLGMQKNCAFYDPSGVQQSVGIPSEKRSYLDAEAVFGQLLKQGYSPNQIIVSGPCRSAAIAFHLKKKYHQEGVNCISEQGFISLEEDMIDPQLWPVRMFAKWNLSALKSRDIPHHIGPEEDYFNTRKKLETLPFSTEGKVIFVHCKEDYTLPEGIENQWIELATKVNKQVYLLDFCVPNGKNGHNESCLKDPQLRKKLIAVIFDKKLS